MIKITMKTASKIKKLIDKGDPLLIFSENHYLIETFHQLLKFRLIDVVRGKIVLTPKGEEAEIIGFDKVIANLKKEDELRELYNRTVH